MSDKAKEWEDRIAKAQKMVAALCRGDERWVMRIPAQPEIDPDLVIADGLLAGLEAVTAYRASHPLTLTEK